MSFALVSYYLPATGHRREKKIKSLCTESGDCLFVQCGRLGQKERNVESSQAEVLGRKMKMNWVPSAPWDTQK